MKICPMCSTYNEDNCVFCSKCGYSFPQNNSKFENVFEQDSSKKSPNKHKYYGATDNNNSNNNMPKQGKKMKKVLKVLGIIALSIVALFVLFVIIALFDEDSNGSADEYTIEVIDKSFKNFAVKQDEGKGIFTLFKTCSDKTTYEFGQKYVLKLYDKGKSTYFNNDTNAADFEKFVNSMYTYGQRTIENNLNMADIVLTDDNVTIGYSALSQAPEALKFLQVFDEGNNQLLKEPCGDILRDISRQYNQIALTNDEKWVYNHQTDPEKQQLIDLYRTLDGATGEKIQLYNGVKSVVNSFVKKAYDESNLSYDEDIEFEYNDKTIVNTQIELNLYDNEIEGYYDFLSKELKNNEDIYDAVVKLSGKTDYDCLNITSKGQYNALVDYLLKDFKKLSKKNKTAIITLNVDDEKNIIGAMFECGDDFYDCMIPNKDADSYYFTYENEKKDKHFHISYDNKKDRNDEVYIDAKNTFGYKEITANGNVKNLRRVKHHLLCSIDCDFELKMGKKDKKTCHLEYFTTQVDGRILKQFNIDDSQLGSYERSEELRKIDYKPMKLPTEDKIIYMYDKNGNITDEFLNYESGTFLKLEADIASVIFTTKYVQGKSA